MAYFLVTTIRRHTPHTEPSGYIYAIDHTKQQILQRSMMIEPAYREVDTNPRGGMRGSRGISVRSDEVAIANASVIFRYDPQWKLLGIITHPSAAAIHDIMYEGDTIWATAARNDLILQFDLKGKLLRKHYLRQPSPALRVLRWSPPLIIDENQVDKGSIDFRDPRTHAEETYDRAHANSLCRLENGDILASMGLVLGAQFSTLLRVKSWMLKRGLWHRLLAVNRMIRAVLHMQRSAHTDLVVHPARAKSAVIRLARDGSHSLVLSLSDMVAPSHSLLALSESSIIYLNTSKGEVVHFDPRNGRVHSTTKVTDGFLRGVIQVSENTLLMGSKGELILYDLPACQVISTMRITEDPNESVYDLKILPDQYALPPDSFEEHFFSTVGFPGEALPDNGYQLPGDQGRQVV